MDDRIDDSLRQLLEEEVEYDDFPETYEGGKVRKTIIYNKTNLLCDRNYYVHKANLWIIGECSKFVLGTFTDTLRIISGALARQRYERHLRESHKKR